MGCDSSYPPPSAAQPTFEARCVAFDLDDTLWSMLDTISAAHDTMIDHMATISPEMSERYRDILAFSDLSDKVKADYPDRASDWTFVRKAAIRRAFDEFQVLATDAEVDACFAAFFVQRNRPFFLPGALETLHELHSRGFQLGAVTDGNADVFRIPELRGLFDFAVTAGQVGCAKPDPRIFQKAIDLAGCPASQMLYIGDNFEKDVVGSSAVGMRAVWVNSPSTLLNPLCKIIGQGSLPDVPANPLKVAKAVVQSLPELLPMLLAPADTVSGQGALRSASVEF